MNKLRSYLFSNISQIFFSIFGTLFLITSVIFLVKIAALTSIIKINFFELVLFYLYTIPKILFYTLPISLFISYLMAFARLSSEYELIVITSLGLKPTKFVWYLMPITLIFTVMMLIVSLGLIPKAEYLNNLLLEQKKKEASFNIKASQFGQKFGDWLMYIDKDDKLTYEGVKLFKDIKHEDAYQFIISDRAEALNNKGELDLTLIDGTTIRFGTDVNQINFHKMFITDTLGDLRIQEYKDSITYWKEIIKTKDIKHFIFYISFSFFPLLSLFLVISYGYYNPRYEKNKTTFYGVVIVLSYILVAFYTSRHYGLNSFGLIAAATLLASILSYQLKIKKLY